MFRPSLKRSQPSSIPLSYFTKPQSLHNNLQKPTTLQTPLQIYQQHQKQFIPLSFFKQQQPPQPHPTSIIFNPLNYEWQAYHPKMQKMVDSRLQAPQSTRGIGCHKQIMWYFQEQDLCLWDRNTNKQICYQLPPDTNCMALGEIQSSSLHFKTSQLYILAIGVNNTLVLFGIDKVSLGKSDLKFCKIISQSLYIQKIKFINQNQIVAVSDTGHYLHCDFSQQTVICQQKQSLIKRALPFLPLLIQPQSLFVQDFKVAGDFIYSLVRQQRETNWVAYQVKEIVGKFMDNKQGNQHIVEKRRINVMKINRQNRSICFVQSIQEIDIIRQLGHRFPEIDVYKQRESLKIVSINVQKKGNQQYLSVVLKNGYFVTLSKDYSIGFQRAPLAATRQCSIGTTGFFIQKKIVASSQAPKSLDIIFSGGLDNLTATQNAYWYLSQSSSQAVKFQQALGQFTQINNQHYKSWIVFARRGFYTIRRLTPKDVFISYLFCRDEIAKKQPQRQWNNQNSFELFVGTLSKVIGNQKLCQIFISCLSQNNLSIKINRKLLEMIRNQLMGGAGKDFQDWTYDMNSRNQNQIIELSTQNYQQIKKYLIDYQHRLPKYPSIILKNKGIHCGAYWYSLRDIFTRTVQPVLNLQPKTMKPNLTSIQQTLKNMQNLSRFISHKRVYQARYLRQNQRNINNNSQNSRSYNRLSIQSNINKNNQTLDDSMIASTHINESSSKLQEIVLINIQKIKHYVTVFLYLAQFSQNQQIPSILSVMHCKKKQLQVKKYLLQRVVDKQKINQFDQYLPQLQLRKDIKFTQWFQCQQKYNLAQKTNLAQVATFFSSTHFDKIKQLLKSRQDIQVDLLLYYNSWLEKDLNNLAQSQLIESYQKLFEQQKLIMIGQKKQLISNQKQFIQKQIQICIGNSIKSYINSQQSTYQNNQKIINNIIQIISRHRQRSSLAYLQMEIRNNGLAEKMFLLKSKNKGSELSNSTVSTRSQQNSTRREYLSTFEGIMVQELN